MWAAESRVLKRGDEAPVHLLRGPAGDKLLAALAGQAVARVDPEVHQVSAWQRACRKVRPRKYLIGIEPLDQS